tara:strand:+ start:1477 stop:1974 length:498 start_codon:yes stop_codon:yes gene_type:complete
MGTMETTTRKYTINDIGCYGEGSLGIYLGQHVQQLALSCGMQIEPIGPHQEEFVDQWTYDNDDAYLNDTVGLLPCPYCRQLLELHINGQVMQSRSFDGVYTDRDIPMFCKALHTNDADHAEEYEYRTNDALDWLNEHMVHDVFFEFFDGEFFLSSIAQREEEDYF